MTRHTFVIQVHPEGISTLENLSTRERVRLDELAEVGPLIERWLGELTGDDDSAVPASPLKTTGGQSPSQ
jgi:hypothetical protein